MASCSGSMPLPRTIVKIAMEMIIMIVGGNKKSRDSLPVPRESATILFPLRKMSR